MGLPIFVVPTEPDAALKAAEKAASGPRSSIRRQRPARRSQAAVSVENIRRRVQSMVADAGPDHYEVWENAMREPLPPPPRRPDLATASHAASHARAARAVEDEQMRLRDTVSFERQHPPNVVVDGPLMPPAPEPRDYASADVRRREIQRLLEVRRDLRRIARRRPAPTPPYTDTDLALMARMGTESPGPSSDTPARSPLTLGERETTVSFSRRPATENSSSALLDRSRRHPRSSSRRPRSQESRNPEQEMPGIDGPGAPAGDPREADRQARADIAERFRVLNRASNHIERSHRFLRQQRLDGLGDRDRSLSPDGGAVAWDTLLTSIAPDPQPPSAGSSFASTSAAAAAASSSAGSGPISTSTPMTSFGRTDDGPALQDCDISDSGLNSDEEEDMQMLNHIVRGASGEPWRSSWVVGRADRVAPLSSAEDTEHLGGMQRIISRLAERDDIPEEWWRMAGLRREPAN